MHHQCQQDSRPTVFVFYAEPSAKRFFFVILDDLRENLRWMGFGTRTCSFQPNTIITITRKDILPLMEFIVQRAKKMLRTGEALAVMIANYHQQKDVLVPIIEKYRCMDGEPTTHIVIAQMLSMGSAHLRGKTTRRKCLFQHHHHNHHFGQIPTQHKSSTKIKSDTTTKLCHHIITIIM